MEIDNDRHQQQETLKKLRRSGREIRQRLSVAVAALFLALPSATPEQQGAQSPLLKTTKSNPLESQSQREVVRVFTQVLENVEAWHRWLESPHLQKLEYLQIHIDLQRVDTPALRFKKSLIFSAAPAVSGAEARAKIAQLLHEIRLFMAQHHFTTAFDLHATVNGKVLFQLPAARDPYFPAIQPDIRVVTIERQHSVDWQDAFPEEMSTFEETTSPAGQLFFDRQQRQFSKLEVAIQVVQPIPAIVPNTFRQVVEHSGSHYTHYCLFDPDVRGNLPTPAEEKNILQIIAPFLTSRERQLFEQDLR